MSESMQVSTGETSLDLPPSCHKGMSFRRAEAVLENGSFVDRSWKATGLPSFRLPLGHRFNSCHPDFFQKQALRTRSRAIPRPFLPSGEGHLERRPVAGAEEWAAGRREWATGRWGFAAG